MGGGLLPVVGIRDSRGSAIARGLAVELKMIGSIQYNEEEGIFC